MKDSTYELHVCYCEACHSVRADINLDKFKSGMKHAAKMLLAKSSGKPTPKSIRLAWVAEINKAAANLKEIP